MKMGPTKETSFCIYKYVFCIYANYPLICWKFLKDVYIMNIFLLSAFFRYEKVTLMSQISLGTNISLYNHLIKKYLLRKK